MSVQDHSARDMALLQGAWEQVGLEEDGVVDPPDAHGAPGALTLIDGNRFVVRTIDGVVLLEGSFELDASASPRAITWIDSVGPDRGKRLPAIYTLEGDRFVFIAGNEGVPRPTGFHTVPGQTMRSFVRKA